MSGNSKVISRRKMTACSAEAFGTLALFGLSGMALARKTEQDKYPILVTLFLRGGIDGLHLVGPANDPNYIAARPSTLRVTDRGEDKGYALKNAPQDLDFRLHKSAGGLKELYDEERLAIVHACGLKNGTRSHFDAQDMMERGTGTQSDGSLSTGWLTRFLNQIPGSGPFRATSIQSETPVSLLGCGNAVAMESPKEFGLWTEGAVRDSLRALYKGSGNIRRAGQTTLDAIDSLETRLGDLESRETSEYAPLPGIRYPGDWPGEEWSQSLKGLAQLIKQDMGIQAATIDLDGWDTHQYQSWTFKERVAAMGSAINAFYNDLSAYHDRLTIVVMSEFGRRLKANQSEGTDHGYGNAMLVIGKHVNGGRILGTWPGLENRNLDSGADLAITTDYRDVLASVIRHQNPAVGPVDIFPGFDPAGGLDLFAADVSNA